MFHIPSQYCTKEWGGTYQDVTERIRKANVTILQLRNKWENKIYHTIIKDKTTNKFQCFV